MNYLWIVGVLLLAVCVFFLLRRKAAPKVNPQELAAKAALLENAGAFSGSFQPLLQAVQQNNAPLAKVLLEMWQQKAAQIPDLKDFFDDVCSGDDPISQANAWLGALERWGVVHDTPGTVFPVTQERASCYLFDDVYGPDTQAKVKRPAWWIREADRLICLETGGAEIQ